MHALRLLLTVAAFSPVAANAALPITVSLESELPGIQNSTSGFNSFGIETFETRELGTGKNFISDFGTGGVFSGSYTNVQINEDDQYGAATGAGQYAVTFQDQGDYSLDLSTTLPGGVTYFGFWLSALDGNNNVSFYQGGTKLFTFSAENARTFINSLPDKNKYYGNPNDPYKNQNSGEPYAFLNFYAKAGTTFDRVVFSQSGGGGYESDNHTVGQWKTISGTVIPPAVPEPQSWALMIAGFGLVGGSMRRRARLAVA